MSVHLSWWLFLPFKDARLGMGALVGACRLSQALGQTRHPQCGEGHVGICPESSHHTAFACSGEALLTQVQAPPLLPSIPGSLSEQGGPQATDSF